MGNIVAIVGRPIVGKSTFFNRLIQKRQAIVIRSVGLLAIDTTVRRTGMARSFLSLIRVDIIGSNDIFEGEIRKQVDLAIEEANAILFLVDAQQGVTDMDMTVAKHLRKSDKPVFLVANKVDNGQIMQEAVELYALGMGDYFCIPSINGWNRGVAR